MQLVKTISTAHSVCDWLHTTSAQAPYVASPVVKAIKNVNPDHADDCHSFWKMKTKITKKTILKFFGILLLILVLSVLILFAVVIGRTFTFKVNTELGPWENASSIYPSLSPEQKKQLLENFKGKKSIIILI